MKDPGEDESSTDFSDHSVVSSGLYCIKYLSTFPLNSTVRAVQFNSDAVTSGAVHPSVVGGVFTMK